MFFNIEKKKRKTVSAISFQKVRVTLLVNYLTIENCITAKVSFRFDRPALVMGTMHSEKR